MGSRASWPGPDQTRLTSAPGTTRRSDQRSIVVCWPRSWTQRSPVTSKASKTCWCPTSSATPTGWQGACRTHAELRSGAGRPIRHRRRRQFLGRLRTQMDRGQRTSIGTGVTRQQHSRTRCGDHIRSGHQSGVVGAKPGQTRNDRRSTPRPLTILVVTGGRLCPESRSRTGVLPGLG